MRQVFRYFLQNPSARPEGRVRTEGEGEQAMSNPDRTPPRGHKDWEGFREVDRAIAENRLTEYRWKKAWADPWERKGLILAGIVGLMFVLYVVVYDGLL